MDCGDYCKSIECLDDCMSSDRLSKPMPFIGLYIAIASLLCCIATIADIDHGLNNKKRWIPCKYFTINAATLTLLSVAVKLPSDFTTKMRNNFDMQAKHVGMTLISAAMANFMPSLGSMSGRGILQNMVALSILVITLSADIIIQMFTLGVNILVSSICLSFLFAQFVLLIHSATTIGVMKERLEKEYYERHRKLVTNFAGLEILETLKVDRLGKYVKYYWVMAVTGSPVFVIARSVTCSAAAALSIMSLLVEFSFLLSAWIDYGTGTHREFLNSDYQWSTILIVGIQLFFIVISTTPPGYRALLTTTAFYLKVNINRFRFTLQIEEYWSASMKAWRQRPLALDIKNRTFRKIIQDVKIIFSEICIIVQIIIVFCSKVSLIMSYLCLSPFFFCIHRCGGLENVIFVELLDIRGYVLVLEGELELPQTILRDICTSLDMVIKKGAKKKGTLLNLLSQKDSFNLQNLMDFDRDEVVSIHSEQPPRSWSLSITSLTCIVLALPTIDHEQKRKLVFGVGEGLCYVRHVEKALDTKNRLENAGKAADVVWNGLDLKNKWLDFNLQGKAFKGKNTKEVLSYPADFSQGIVRVFRDSTKTKLMENPLNWPENIIAANSLNRVSQTMLLHYDHICSGNLQPDEVLFKKTVAMIYDIFVACLVNLPRLIMDKCFLSRIEKREESVGEAALLLGATEDILQFLEGHVNLPTLLTSDDATYIDDWRALIKNQNPTLPTNVNPTFTRCASI